MAVKKWGLRVLLAVSILVLLQLLVVVLPPRLPAFLLPLLRHWAGGVQSTARTWYDEDPPWRTQFLQVYKDLNDSYDIDNLEECQGTTFIKPCRDRKCQANIPADPLIDLDLVKSRLPRVPDKFLSVMQQMEKRAAGSADITIVTGNSANHFQESQGLVRSLHLHLFPALRRRGLSFRFLYYDLGLGPDQRRLLEKRCQCTVLDFPFKEFPPHVERLNCYAWKPIIIASHFNSSSMTAWFDASIRITNVSLTPILQHVNRLGFAADIIARNLAVYTAPPMLERFGDTPCRYSPYPHFQAGVCWYRRTAWVLEALMKPWVSCALDPLCQCPPGRWRELKGLFLGGREGPYGRAHRYDQAALGVLLARLFRARSLSFDSPRYYEIQRGDIVSYFKP